MSVKMLRWGADISNVTRVLNARRPDVILAADVVFERDKSKAGVLLHAPNETFNQLANTILALSDPLRTEVLLAYRSRYVRENIFFRIMQAHCAEIVLVPQSGLHIDFRNKGFAIYHYKGCAP